MYLCRVIEDEPAAAIGAIGLAGLTDRQVNERVAQGPAAAIATDSRSFNMNNFGWLHRKVRSTSLDNALGSKNMLCLMNMRIVKNMPDRFRQAAASAIRDCPGPIDRNDRG